MPHDQPAVAGDPSSFREFAAFLRGLPTKRERRSKGPGPGGPRSDDIGYFRSLNARHTLCAVIGMSR
jgi:hypothetical protein